MTTNCIGVAVTFRSLSNLSGLALSLACVIHCMLMPICLASLPAWGLSWLSSPYVHQVLALLGVGIGIATLVPGWKRHRRHTVLLWAAFGLVVMNYAAFAAESCCTVSTEGSSTEVPACCRDTACVAPNTKTQTVATKEGSVLALWDWLCQHPTVLGAACLAWAHCLNGGCTRSCCESNIAQLPEAESVPTS